ncbi:MAG: cytochrome C biogenesis protein [Acidobacteria bacterium]|nr:MAG: cytochrome C biogenesis protein [Acidobacteriota bacterium]
MNQVGSAGLVAALAFARSAERATLAFFLMITVAVVALETSILSNDFHTAYVAAHSNKDLPVYYKIAVLWAGQEGSLLFWTWLLSIYGGLAVLLNHRKNRQLMPYVVAIILATGVFFTSVTFFVANPFSVLSVERAGGLLPLHPPEGNGLNPSLQYHPMVIHPPMLYLGYVGFVVPYAFAISALITKQLADNWIRVTRRWAMVPWMFLGVGIRWDPVENASLLPWLAATAFLHSVMIQEKRGMLKVWNMVLVMATFFLCIFGTFLTRSGIVSSVHAFAQSNIGIFFAVFLGIIIFFSLTLLFLRLDFLKSENRLDSVVSRESGFLFNNWILLAAVFAVLWGTIFPIISKAVEDKTVTVGPPYYNKTALPIGLLLLFLTGAGPLLAWRKTSFQSLRRNFTLPLAVAVVAGAGLFFAGIRDLYPWMALTLAIFVAACVLQEFYKGARTRQKIVGENFAHALYNLTMRNTRRYGGYVIHLGIVLLFVGFAGLAFKTEAKATMDKGDLLRVKDYVLRCEGISKGETPNYLYERAELSIVKDGRALGTVLPEKRLFKASQESISHVALRPSLAQDLYVVLAGNDEDTGKVLIQVFINPLVAWVWMGGLVVFLGTLLAMVPSRIERELEGLRRPVEEAIEEKHAF